MATRQVTYVLDDETVVQFEIEETDTFRPVGAEEVVGRVREAVRPAVEAARAVLDRVREVRPAQVEVKFGVKATGTAPWLVARHGSGTPPLGSLSTTLRSPACAIPARSTPSVPSNTLVVRSWSLRAATGRCACGTLPPQRGSWRCQFAMSALGWHGTRGSLP